MEIICNENWLAHIDQLFHSKKVLKIYDLYNLHLGCIMYQLNQNELPRALTLLFLLKMKVTTATQQGNFITFQCQEPFGNKQL